MSALASIQGLVFLLLTVAAFIVELVAFIDSLRYRDEVYRAADKRSKTFWTLILGISAVVGFLAMPPLQAMPIFISLLGFVAAAVYFADVRKGLRAVDPRFRNR